MKRAPRSGGKRAAAGGCRACGVCCDLYGHTLYADDGDRARWRAQGRLDLLQQVGPDGELWWAAAAVRRLDYCPHFSWQGAERGRCAIHATKPAVCRAYPTALHGHHCVMGERFPRDQEEGQR